MPSADQAVRTYRELAEDYGRQGQAQLRDRFLVLAADAALAAGHRDEAEVLRGRLLQHNPHHLLKPYRSFAEAMQSPDVQNYVGGLRRSHPYEKAETLLEGLRRQAKFGSSTREVAAAAKDVKGPGIGDRAEEPKGPSAPAGAEASPASPGSSPSAVRPVIPAQLPQAFAPVRLAAAPDPVPAPRDPYPPLDSLRAAAVEKEGRDPSTGAWVSTALFLVVFVMGLVLAAYTLLRPFLPQKWL